MSQPATLWDCLARAAVRHPDKVAFIYLDRGERETGRLTYGALFLRARRIAAALKAVGLAGRTVLMAYPSGLEFVTAFFGCLAAGAVAAPAPSLTSAGSASRLAAMMREARPSAVLTTGPGLAALRGMAALGEVPALATDTIEADLAFAADPVPPGPDALAFLQFTSGSTRQPKGVMVAQANIVANMEALKRAFGQDEETRIVSWLPLFHDMGLLCCVLQAVYLGGCCILFSPLAFLQKPARWLRAVSDHRATTSGAPNFAYELCRAQVKPEQIADLDLSSWSLAFCGAEPVRAPTMDGFAERFAPAGFAAGALYPCYGLAEATLFVSGGAKGTGVQRRSFEAEALARDGRARPAPGPGGRTLVSAGRVGHGLAAAIVHPETGGVCGPGETGEIWLAGDSVAKGYFGRPEETAATFQAEAAGLPGRWLRTGDLGFLLEDALYVSGRLKDLIIVRGANHHPEDLEATVAAAHESFLGGMGAAVAVDDGEREALVVLQELGRQADRNAPDLAAAAAAAAAAVVERHGLRPDVVALLPRGALPKTTSGKIQRSLSRAAYLDGRLPILARTAPQPAAARR